MAAFNENYLDVTDKVVEILKAEAAVGSGKFLDGIVAPESIHWGSPTKEKRDVYEGVFSLFALPGGTDLFTNSTSSYDVIGLQNVLVWGMVDDLDAALRTALDIQGRIVDVFTKKENEDLGGCVRVINNPKGGQDFSLTEPGFQPAGGANVDSMREYWVWLSVSFYAHFIQPVDP